MQETSTWVLADSNANGPGELSVQRGQQVEVIGPALSANSSMVLVRLQAGHGGQAGQEGLVPATCLKQPAGGFKFKNGSSRDHDGKCD